MENDTIIPIGALQIDLNIEELEKKIAPDGGETVLPLSRGGR